jgi:hypothetical protein
MKQLMSGHFHRGRTLSLQGGQDTVRPLISKSVQGKGKDNKKEYSIILSDNRLEASNRGLVLPLLPAGGYSCQAHEQANSPSTGCRPTGSAGTSWDLKEGSQSIKRLNNS